MKIITLTVAVFFTSLTSVPVQALTHKYPCDELIFDATTKDGNKRVQLCKSKGQINYNFGSVNGDSELDILIPLKHAVLHTSQYSHNPDPAVELFRGNYSYTVFSNMISVVRNEILLAEIPLNRPVYNNMLEALLPSGVPITRRPFTFSYFIKDIENATQHQPV